MLKQQNFFDRNIPAWKQVLFLSWPTIVELLLQTALTTWILLWLEASE